MAQQVRRRPQKTVTYQANAKADPVELSRGMLYRELHLRLIGQPTLTAANNTAANTQRGDEWGVLKRLDVLANNVDTIFSIDGNALWWVNYFLFGARPKVTVTLGDATTVNPSFDSVLVLPFWMPQSIRPIDTMLDARRLSQLSVEATWGDHLSINSAATAFTTAPKLEVKSLEAFNLPDDVAFSTFRIWKIEKEITATNPRFEIDLPVGNMFRAFLLNFTDAGVDDNSVLNNFKWVSGTTVFADVDDQSLQQVQALRYNQQRSFTGQLYDDDRIGDDNDITGWYLYDHVTDGFNSEALDTLGFSEHKLELDVTVAGGTTKAIVYPLEIVPVRQVNAGVARAA